MISLGRILRVLQGSNCRTCRILRIVLQRVLLVTIDYDSQDPKGATRTQIHDIKDTKDPTCRKYRIIKIVVYRAHVQLKNVESQFIEL